MHLSFLLLPSETPINAVATVEAFKELFPELPQPTLADDKDDDGAIVFELDELTIFVALMPAAVPDQEAEQAGAFSLAGFGGKQPDYTHPAHALVTTMTAERPVIQSLALHTCLVAALAKACDAVGVYEGEAGATHPTDFYIDLAQSSQTPMLLWTGVSIAPEAEDIVSFLTLGMRQFDLPDIYLRAPRERAQNAIPFLYDLALYTVNRGEKIPEGETVGPTADIRHPIRYVKAPNGTDAMVALLDLVAATEANKKPWWKFW